MTDGICANCVYFRNGRADGDGECHRHAPTLTSRAAEVSERVRAYRVRTFPPVASGDWCGEFEAAS